jgi:hypothetical protein
MESADGNVPNTWSMLFFRCPIIFQRAKGLMYVNEQGALQDYKEAVKWFNLSAVYWLYVLQFFR